MRTIGKGASRLATLAGGGGGSSSLNCLAPGTEPGATIVAVLPSGRVTVPLVTVTAGGCSEPMLVDPEPLVEPLPVDPEPLLVDPEPLVEPLPVDPEPLEDPLFAEIDPPAGPVPTETVPPPPDTDAPIGGTVTGLSRFTSTPNAAAPAAVDARTQTASADDAAATRRVGLPKIRLVRSLNTLSKFSRCPPAVREQTRPPRGT